MSKRAVSKKERRVCVPVSLPASMDHDVNEASAALKMSKQDTIRQAVNLGLPALLRALGVQPEAQAAPSRF